MIIHICVIFRCSRSKAYQNSFSAGVTQLAQSSIFLPKSLLSQNKKNQIRISCDSAHVLSMSTLIIKLHGILLEFFRGVAVTICFICVFKFAQTSKLKRGKIHRNIQLNQKFLIANAQLYSKLLLSAMFHEIPLSSFRGVAMTIISCGSNFYIQRGVTPR